MVASLTAIGFDACIRACASDVVVVVVARRRSSDRGVVLKRPLEAPVRALFPFASRAAHLFHIHRGLDWVVIVACMPRPTRARMHESAS